VIGRDGRQITERVQEMDPIITQPPTYKDATERVQEMDPIITQPPTYKDAIKNMPAPVYSQPSPMVVYTVRL
jgi:hypothetical protein